MFDMLEAVYEKASTECDIDIAFRHAADGSQQNDCRDLLLAYLRGPTIARGRPLAERLEQYTTGRSGHGLFFLIAGREQGDTKILISRFPADTGILAEEDRSSLNVQFLERIFMKSANTYKAALYQDRSMSSGFWEGRCVDKQINDPATRVSDYWIVEFLASSLRVTSAAGTYRLATALRAASRNARDLSVKEEIAAAVKLARGLHRRRLSIDEFANHFRLTPAAREAIMRELRDPELASERFQFDYPEFSTEVAYRSVELDSGAIVTAEASQFDEVVKRQKIDGARVRLSVEGRVTGERLRKAT
jgi:hypothetical protein